MTDFKTSEHFLKVSSASHGGQEAVGPARGILELRAAPMAKIDLGHLTLQASVPHSLRKR